MDKVSLVADVAKESASALFLTFFDVIALRGWKILITSAPEENNFKMGASREIYGDMD